LCPSPYFPGNEITAADILWAMALKWGAPLQLLPENPLVADYVKRMTARPAFTKTEAIDAYLVIAHEAAAGVG
jgi:glutathione S-transferase